MKTTRNQLSITRVASYHPFAAFRNTFARLLHWLLLFMLSASVQAQFAFVTNNGALTITGYTGSGGVVTIPSETNGLPVTSIGYAAFRSRTSLTSVTIPDSVADTGIEAFYGCTRLAHVTMSNSVTNIGSGTFSGCTSLTSVVMGNSVVSIGDRAFYRCIALANLTVPNDVASIGINAFRSCSGLVSVTIPGNVTNIGDQAFSECTSLSAITADALNPVYSSGDGVLFNRRTYNLIQYPGGKAGNYTVPSGVTSIQDWAFYTCNSLTSVTIGNNVTNIGREAFFSCTSLTNAIIGNSVTGIGAKAFEYCTSLTSVAIGKSVTCIGARAFSMTRLTTVTLPGCVTGVGESAFALTSLTRAYFRGNAPSLDGAGDPFQYQDAVTVYYLPGTTGWGATFADRPTALWVLPNPVILTCKPSFGIQTNAFGFRVSWATNRPVIVDASASLANPAWLPLQTNALTAGWFHFSDPDWTNHPGRFYRIRSP